ncbi:isochorismatase family protein [Candidatus Desantisbacteria bacterium]|nr:isochorismatase family protein [Candidatus Desantisbacteria bacterium]
MLLYLLLRNFNTKLEKLIDEYLPFETDVIIGGNCTDICVHYTAEELRNRDYNVVIPADCVDTYDLSEKKCKELGLSLNKAHPAYAINDFFLKNIFLEFLE